MQARLSPSHLVAAVVGGLAMLALLAVSGNLASLGTGASAPPTPTPEPSPSPAFAEGMTLGRPDAPVAIEIWADFQCPFCRLLSHGIEPELVRTYAASGRARITFRDFAFLGPESLDAAVAARCAARQDAFWRYHDLLFASQQGENQGAFRREVLRSLAGFAGLDGPSFEACLDDPTVAAAVAAETAEGRRLGIDSTPTLRLLGPGGSELLRGLVGFDAITVAVERIASPAPSRTPSSPAPSGTDAPGSGPSSTPRP